MKYFQSLPLIDSSQKLIKIGNFGTLEGSLQGANGTPFIAFSLEHWLVNATTHRTRAAAVSQALACQCKSLRELPKPGKRRSFPKICLFCRVDLLQKTNSSWYCRQMGRSGYSIFTVTHPWDNLVDFQTSMNCLVNNFAVGIVLLRTKPWHIVSSFIRNETKSAFYFSKRLLNWCCFVTIRSCWIKTLEMRPWKLTIKLFGESN